MNPDNCIEKIKGIDIRSIIETETGNNFSKYNQLSECPFCKSGTGVYKSPAFSVNTKKNYYKCFSCGSQGSVIDFIMLTNKGWKEGQAIKYLKENYLNEASHYKPNQELTPFQKTLYAICKNPIKKAKEYLEGRSIQTDKLPGGAYYYDSLSKAVVFTDSKNQLINRRAITPKKGEPKAKNQGLLTNSIYDSLFNPEPDTAFLHEGVINALSMPDYSSIAIFSTENKVKNTSVLQQYVTGKHVVLAMDNDNAGNGCAEYYQSFLLMNGFGILSLRRLVFPEGKDANNLLAEGKLKDFIKNEKNYELLWEDIVTKPMPLNSKNKRKDNDEHFFFVEKGCYFVKEFARGKPIVKKLSNFLMESVYHLMDGTKESNRLIKFQRNTGEITLTEISSSELNLDRFKKVIRSISCRGLTFFGNTQQLDHILTYLYDRESNATSVVRLGYQQEHKLYCFADAVLTNENKVLYPDKLGIVTHNNTKLYLAPFAYTNNKNKEYQGLRKFRYKEGNLDFATWAELMYAAYGINGAIGITYVILAIFRDYILGHTGFFPFLFLFGDQGAGKSNFVNFFLHLFGEPNNGISLLNSTDKGFSRSLTQYNNALYYLKEYTNSIDKKTVDVFKTGYDGELYTMAQKSNDNKTTTLEISSACMVDGNELPTSEAALFARMIVLHFENNKFSETSTKAYKKLVSEKEVGFGKVIRALISQRTIFESKFKHVFNQVFQELKDEFSQDGEISDRQLRHVALLLTPAKVLKNKLAFPFQFEEYKEAVIENARNQDEMSNEIKDVAIFWNAIAFKISEPRSELMENKHYLMDNATRILYIKFKLLYPYYTEYAKKNNLHFLEISSMRELLTSKGNKSFIPNNSQPSRKTKSYTHKTFGSCYKFRFTQTTNPNTILVDGVEVNL